MGPFFKKGGSGTVGVGFWKSIKGYPSFI